MERKRERAVLCYVPQWEGVIEKWTRGFIRDNKWRVDHTNSPEDLLQDFFIIFMKICRMYPRVVEPANFFALYQRAVINKTNDMSLYLMRKRALHQETGSDVSEIYSSHIGEMTNGGYAACLWAEAPEEVKLAVQFMVENPQRMKGSKGRKRENLNAKLRRALGYKENFKFSESVRGLFEAT